MGIVGRASVVHFAGVTQWTYIGKQMNGIRLVQMHPNVAAGSGIRNGDAILVESPRGSITGTALVWKGIREDTIFVPNSFGPMQAMGDEFARLDTNRRTSFSTTGTSTICPASRPTSALPAASGRQDERGADTDVRVDSRRRRAARVQQRRE
jgi:anaerobic selenocysteine-containing dehydrogenase